MEGINSTESKKSPEILRTEHVLACLGLRPEDLEGKSTLDIGSGRGFVGKAAKEWGYDVVSIDKDPYLAVAVDEMRGKDISDPEAEMNAFREAHENAKTKQLDTPNLVVGDARALPFKDESFDLIISYAGPININARKPEERERILAESARVLKPGGEFRFGPAWGKTEMDEPEMTRHEATTSQGQEVAYYSFTK